MRLVPGLPAHTWPNGLQQKPFRTQCPVGPEMMSSEQFPGLVRSRPDTASATRAANSEVAAPQTHGSHPMTEPQ
jgi:hypothetical protein